MNRILVCGGRDYDKKEELARALVAFHTGTMPIDILIHGAAKGADTLAGDWATRRGIHTASVKALWSHYDKAAGHRRNAAMLMLQPHYCIAFPGGRGTQIMVDLCNEAGVPVWRPYGC